MIEASRTNQNNAQIIECNFGVQAVDMENGDVLWIEGNSASEVDRGLGGALLLSLLLKNISLGKIRLNEHVTIGSTPAKEAKSKGSIGLLEGEKVSIHTLLEALIIHNAPDAILALSEKLYTISNSSTLKAMKDLAKQLGLSENAVTNITGRLLRAKPQAFNLSDLNKAARYLFSFPDIYLRLLNTTLTEYKGKLYTSPSHLIARGKIFGGYLFGHNNGEGIVLAYIKGRKVALSVCGARDAFHRDYLLTTVIDYLTFSAEKVDSASARETFRLPGDKTRVINFLGDTYFGEDYMNKRQKRGERNILSEFGYDYSFKIIEPLLSIGDLNIANFEAVLTDADYSQLSGTKPYILGGKVQESIAALNRQHIHAVTLGNNHAMDYGVQGLDSTINAFKNGNIPAIGAGITGRDASEPLRINVGNYEIIIFGCYWYRQQAYQSFDFYAIGNKPGVACLSGEVLDRIRAEKKESPNAFVITLVHWGSDFERVVPTQRNYAKQLLDSGTDLIIGHGAHMMQEVEYLNNKWVVYSIGNGVFNSNGEYDIRNVPPYSFLLQMHIEKSGVKHLRLYPLYSNNLNTLWQTHVTNNEQFKEVIEYQTLLGTKIDKFRIGTDEFGSFMEATI